MPRPIPEYVPGPIVDIIRQKRWSGLNNLAKAAGMKRTTCYFFFSDSEHETLRAYSDFCSALGVTMDDGLSILRIEDAYNRMLIWDRLIRNKYRTYEDCASAAGISDSYVSDIVNGANSDKLVNQYAPMATALGLSLGELATILGVVEKAKKY